VLRSLTRSPRQIVKIWPGDAQGITVGPRIALFVHFDGAGAVRPHVLRYLESLNELGLSIVFVTNSAFLRPDALESLKPFCAAVIIRRNVGYDFGAMREGLEQLTLPRPDTELLLIVNDSVYGPLQPLAEILDKVDFEKADMWGATESWQTRYHLQSYFLVAGRRVLETEAWRSFWRNVRPVSSKPWIIERYEIGLTQWLLRAGLRCAALWPYYDLVQDIDPQLLEERKERRIVHDAAVHARRYQARHIRTCVMQNRPLNPTSDLWRQLLNAGFPFIKRELLRNNPGDVPDAADWRDVVRGRMGADTTLIERDLQRIVRNRTP
jgi:lipopolysaccharide biosynthesis protein